MDLAWSASGRGRAGAAWLGGQRDSLAGAVGGYMLRGKGGEGSG